jgi:hypothetical protein
VGLAAHPFFFPGDSAKHAARQPRRVLPGLAAAALDALAFFAPFAWLRLRRAAAPAPRARAPLAIAAAVGLGIGAFAARQDPSIAELPFAVGLLLLGVAAAPRDGWRFVAPAGGALGLVVLAGMAFGPLHPLDLGPHIPPPPALTLMAWTLLAAGSLTLLAPWRWASAAAVALFGLALLASEPSRSFYVGAPALMAIAALLSAALPARREGP